MKGKRPRRKIILFLVEGLSEKSALDSIVNDLYCSIDEGYDVFFPPLREDGIARGGDITTLYGINPQTIEKCIVKLFIKDFLTDNKLYPKDITEIVHIVDMDGAYIPDSQVVFGENPNGSERPYYASSEIVTTDVLRMIERNRQKRENLDYLVSLHSIKVESKTIPYSVYFFSSNLDHFLHDNANVADAKTKVDLAIEYALGHENNPEQFVREVENTPGALVNMTYEESWAYIRERNDNSISRHTNICVLFTNLKSKEG